MEEIGGNEFMNAHPQIFGKIDRTKNYLDEELWKVTAGPKANFPTLGEKVYYFPQGHIEGLGVSTKEELDQMKPIFDIPSKIPCRVIQIQLEAEKVTDEVYAKITLSPDTNEAILPISDGNQQRPIVHSFTKILSMSDTTTYGGFSIPKKHASKCLPPLDMSQSVPAQELIMKDLHGYEWRFKHIIKGTPPRHLLTTGWCAFVTAKKLVVGDAVVFLRGEHGELRVGIRRATHPQGNVLSSVISTQCIHHGVISYVMHKTKTHNEFIVNYKPRTTQFVVSFDKFVNALNKKINKGSRVKMSFEDKNFKEKIYFGTVIDSRDFSPHWKDSEWRSLEVNWDDHESVSLPDKVSLWEIDHLAHSFNVPQLAMLNNKRSYQDNETGLTTLNLWSPSLEKGQEIGQSSMYSPMSNSQLHYHDTNENTKIPSGWLMKSYSAQAMPKLNNIDQQHPPLKENPTDAISETKYHMEHTYLNKKVKISELSEEEKLAKTETLASPNEVHSKQVNSTICRVKVQMEGVALCSVVDLTVLDGYNSLIEELENFFDLKDELRTRNKWEIVFTDDEGDMMLLGDDPWFEFSKMVKKIYIQKRR